MADVDRRFADVDQVYLRVRLTMGAWVTTRSLDHGDQLGAVASLD
jgi:hypothetical protein